MDKVVAPSPLMRQADRGPELEITFSHPLNPASEVHFTPLGDHTGLKRLGIHLVRVPPGKESYVYHRHFGEEEFIYILSGRGLAEIDDQEYEVGPGDFMGFPTPSVGHHMKNPFSEELVYLSGGERRDMEIADFPRHALRMLRAGMKISITPTTGDVSFPGFEELK